MTLNDPPLGGGILKPIDEESNLYQLSDKGPFKINIEYNINNDNKIINKIKVGQTLQDELKYKEVIDIKKFSKNTVVAYVNNYITANKIVKDKELLNKFNFKAYIPKSYNYVSGVLKNIDDDINLENLKNELNYNNYKCVEITRMTKMNKETGLKSDLSSVKIMIRSTVLPEKVKAYKTNIKVFPLFGKIKQCDHCLRYGHFKEQCKSAKKKCVNCGDSTHEANTCQTLKCIHCKKNHRADDPECEERARQKNIKFLMAKFNLGYYETLEQYPIKLNNAYDLLENYEEFPKLQAPKKNIADIIKENNKPFTYTKSMIVQEKPKRQAIKSVNYRLQQSHPINPLAGPSYNLLNKKKDETTDNLQLILNLINKLAENLNSKQQQNYIYNETEKITSQKKYNNENYSNNFEYKKDNPLSPKIKRPHQRDAIEYEINFDDIDNSMDI